MANIIPYREFLKRKELREQETGITVSPQQLHPSLFDWQKRIVTWACKVGRAAVWADTGLGKTRMQLEWLRQVCAGGRMPANHPRRRRNRHGSALCA